MVRWASMADNKTHLSLLIIWQQQDEFRCACVCEMLVLMSYGMMVCRKALLKSHGQLYSLPETKGYKRLKKKIENSRITRPAVYQHANCSESGDVCDSLITLTSGRQWLQRIRNLVFNIDISLNIMYNYFWSLEMGRALYASSTQVPK